MASGPQVVTFSSSLSACEKAAQWPQALQLLHEAPVDRRIGSPGSAPDRSALGVAKGAEPSSSGQSWGPFCASSRLWRQRFFVFVSLFFLAGGVPFRFPTKG